MEEKKMDEEGGQDEKREDDVSDFNEDKKGEEEEGEEEKDKEEEEEDEKDNLGKVDDSEFPALHPLTGEEYSEENYPSLEVTLKDLSLHNSSFRPHRSEATMTKNNLHS